MANIINPNFLSLPQQVQKNKEDILKILASEVKDLTGLQFVPTGVIYQNDTAILNGKFIVIREGDEAEIEGVVQLPLIGDNGINVDASEDDLKVRISLDQSDRELFNFVEELVEATGDDNHIVFTEDMTSFVNSSIATAIEGVEKVETIYDSSSPDIELNWGLTSGFYNNTINRDFSKYKRLKCYCVNTVVFDIPCNGQTARMLTQCYNLGSNGSQYVYGIEGEATSSSLKFKSLNYQGSQTADNVNFIYIIKIEGVY